MLKRVLVGIGATLLVVAGAVIVTLVQRDGTSTATSRYRDAVGAEDRAARESLSAGTATTTTTRPRRGSGVPVTFAFGGDVHFEGSLRTRLVAGPETLLAPIAPLLGAVDVAVVNLETAVTDGGTPAPKKYTFRAPPLAYVALASAGIDAASLANNHGVDYGFAGLQDTIQSARAVGYPLLGVGQNATEAYAALRLEVRGQRIAVLGATQVLDDNVLAAWTATDAQPGLASAKVPDLERLLVAVRSARVDSDTVVVYLHWGAEGEECPSGAQQDLARQLVDAGADIVVGGHAHRVQGAGRLGSAVVSFGLGNFVWYNESGSSGQSGVLLVTATGRDIDAYSWAPARIRDGIPHPLEGEAAAGEVARWDGLRACTGLVP